MSSLRTSVILTHPHIHWSALTIHSHYSTHPTPHIPKIHTLTALSHIHHPNTLTNTQTVSLPKYTLTDPPTHTIQVQHTLILHSSYPRETVGSRGARFTATVMCSVCQSHSFTSNSANMGRASKAPHLLQSTGSSNMEPITLPPPIHRLTHIYRATLIQCRHGNNSQHYFH